MSSDVAITQCDRVLCVGMIVFAIVVSAFGLSALIYSAVVGGNKGAGTRFHCTGSIHCGGASASRDAGLVKVNQTGTT
jgi:hypothetical protein